jgi:hypothetical protein
MLFLSSNPVKEFLETAKEVFEDQWKNPHKVSTKTKSNPISSLSLPVQDFLDKAKKEFEDNWSKNQKVSRMRMINEWMKGLLLNIFFSLSIDFVLNIDQTLFELMR